MSEQDNTIQTNAQSSSQASTETQPTENKPKDLIDELISKITISYIPEASQFLTLETYKQISDSALLLRVDEYNKTTAEFREGRRKHMNSNKQVYKMTMQYTIEEQQNVIAKAQRDLLSKLGLKDAFEQTPMYFMGKGQYQEIANIAAEQQKKLSKILVKKNDVNSELANEIIQYSINILTEKEEFFMEIFKILKGGNPFIAQQFAPAFIELMINDLVFEKYSVEVEDYAQYLENQPEYQEKIQKGIQDLLNKSGIFDDNQDMF